MGTQASLDAYFDLGNLKAAQVQLARYVMDNNTGVTIKDYARATGQTLNQVSGRFSELHTEGYLFIDEDERRDKCSVYYYQHNAILRMEQRELLRKTKLDNIIGKARKFMEDNPAMRALMKSKLMNL